MKIEEALQVVLDLAEDKADNSIIDRHASEAERKEVAKNRRTAIDTVQDFHTNVVLEGRHETPPPKVLIWMEGGLIQSIDASQPVEVVVIDEDTEGGNPENISTIKLFGDNEKETDFYVNDWGVIESDQEVAEHYFSEARKEKPKPKKEDLEEDEGGFIILDTWGEIMVCIDEEGKVLRFDSEKDAYEYGQDLQSFQVVKLEH